MPFLKVLGNNTNRIRAVFALIILLVALTEGVGTENILGALGVIVSLLGPDQDMIEKLDSFGYGFSYQYSYHGRCKFKHTSCQRTSLLLIIPLLFIAFLISKLIPVSIIENGMI